jgi:AAA+ superfamily predicted ATPase
VFESTLFDALDKPLSAIGVDVTRALMRMRPHKAILCVEWFLDIGDFHRAGRCTLEPLTGLPLYAHAFWSEEGTLFSQTRQGWHRITWEGHTLELITLTWGLESPDSTWWVIAEAADVAERFLKAVHDFDDLATSRVLIFEEGRFTKSARMGASIAGGSFDDLVLGGNLAPDIRSDARRFFERRDFYERYRLPWKRGLLLVGPPGNGKTQTVRALLKELNRPVLFVRSFAARCEKRDDNIRTVFARARKMAPMVLVLEDIDCLIDESSRSAFLNELDGLVQNTGLLTLATTNHPEKLDRSILDRPSRFDRKFHFPLPGDAERRACLHKWNTERPEAMRLSGEGLERVVERSKGFTFAYLKELMLSASLRWADEGVPGTMDGIAQAMLKTLHAEMESAAVLLGPIDARRNIGFAEASR